MARFVFRLRPLLELRRRIEREHQRKVAGIQQEANQLVAKIQHTERTIATQNATLAREKLVGTLDLAYIANEKRFVHTLQMLIAATLQQLAAVDKRLGAAKAELLAAAKARKAIEKVREKQYERWLTEENRKEAAVTDELGTQLAVRKMIAEALAEAATG